MKSAPMTHTGQYTLFKDKLPRGQSYPINRTLLDSQLKQCGIELINILSMSYIDEMPWCIFVVHYCGIKSHPAPTFDVNVSAVPSDIKKRCGQAIMEIFFPQLCIWKKQLDTLPQTQLYNGKSLYFYHNNGKFEVSEQRKPQPSTQHTSTDWFKNKTRMKRNSRYNSNKR